MAEKEEVEFRLFSTSNRNNQVLPATIETNVEPSRILHNETVGIDESNANLMPKETQTPSIYAKRSHKCIIRSSNRMRIRWDLLIIILALYNSISVPFTVAFETNQEYILFDIWEYFVDFLFLIDIFVNFRCTYIDRNGDEIFEPRPIAKRYVISGNFFIDLLAVIPFELIPSLFNTDVSSRTLALFQVLKMVRLLRLRRIITYLKFKTDFKLGIRILLIIFNLFLFVHMAGCFWHMIVDANQDWIPPKDFGRQTDYYNEDNRSSQYITSLYYASLMLLGADILPYDEVQTTYACIILLAGSIVTATLFGHMTVLVQSLNKKTAKFHEQLDIANQAMTNIALPDHLQTKVLEYLSYTYSNMDHQDEFRKFSLIVSPSLKHEVYMHLYRDCLMRNPHLSLSEEVVEAMTYKLETNLSDPETVIIKKGDQSNSVYFISRGEVIVKLWDENCEESLQKELMSGEYFGEVGVLLDVKRTATVITKNYCTIAGIQKADLEELFDRFPELYKKMYTHLFDYSTEWLRRMTRALKSLPYFSRCSRPELCQIAYKLKSQKYEAGNIVVDRGQKVDFVLIVGTASLSICIEREKSFDLDVLTLKSWSVCFISSGLAETTQPFTIKVTQSGLMFRITQDILDKIYQKIPHLKNEIGAFTNLGKQGKAKKVDDFRVSSFNKCQRWKLATLRVIRDNKLKRELKLGGKLALFNLIDSVVEQEKSKVKEEKEDETDPNWEFKQTLAEILKNTSDLASQIDIYNKSKNR